MNGAKHLFHDAASHQNRLHWPGNPLTLHARSQMDIHKKFTEHISAFISQMASNELRVYPVLKMGIIDWPIGSSPRTAGARGFTTQESCESPSPLHTHCLLSCCTTFSLSTSSRSAFFCIKSVIQSGSVEDERPEEEPSPCEGCVEELSMVTSLSCRRPTTSCFFFSSWSRSQVRAPQIRLRDLP